MLPLALLMILAQDPPPPHSLADEGFAGLGIHAEIRMYSIYGVNGGLKGERDEPYLSLDDDLDLDRPGWSPEFEAAYLWNDKRDDSIKGIGISAAAFATSGKTTLESNEVFQDHLFPAGTAMRSRFRFKEFGVDGFLMSRHDIKEPYGLRGGLGIHYLEAEIHLSGATGTESEEYADVNFKLFLEGEVRPVEWFLAGAGASVYTDIFSWLAGVDSGHYGGELEAFVGIQAGPVRLEGGFRVFGWTLNWSKSEIDLVTYGPWAALSSRF